MLPGSTLRRAFSTGNLYHITNDQRHLILADGKLFVFGIDPNEKAMIKGKGAALYCPLMYLLIF